MSDPERCDGSDVAGTGMSRGLGETYWLGYARRRPGLARLLVRATCGRLPDCGADFEGWCARFVRRPPWAALAESLRQPLTKDPSTNSVPLAVAARIIAGGTGWCRLETAYWFSLCRPIEPLFEPTVGLGSWLEALSGPERCRALAARLLGAFRRPADPLFIETPFGGAILPAELQPFSGRWSDLLPEIQIAAIAQSDSFTPVDQHCLRQSALANCRDVEVNFYRTLSAIWMENSAEGRIRAVLALVAQQVDGPTALWFEMNGASGVGATSMPKGPAVFRGSRHEFEARLDPCLRISTELCGALGAPVGRIYLAEPFEIGHKTQVIVTALEQALRMELLESEIARLQTAAEESNRRLDELLRGRLRSMMSEFASGAAHEINNPLATIRGYAQRLLVGEVDPERRQMLKRIDEQADRIHRMIEDLHLVGRPGGLRREPVRLERVLDRAAAAAAKRRPAARLTLEPVEAWQVAGSEADLVRLFTEVVDNALFAAGAEGSVHLRTSASADGRQVSVVIADSGQGLTDLDRRCALGPFYSGRSAGRGLGMGLAVAARIAEDHGGTIRFASEPGNCVIVTLPVHSESGLASDSVPDRNAA